MRAGSGTQVRVVRVVPVAALDVEVEVARGLEGHVGRRCPGVAPCQCQAPGGLLTTSPARTTCTPSSSATAPTPSTNTRCWPLRCWCGTVRAPAPKYTAMESKPGSAQGSACTRTSSGWLNSDLSWPGTGSPLAPAVVPNSSMGCPDPGRGGLTKTYPGEPAVHPMRGVSLTIDQVNSPPSRALRVSSPRAAGGCAHHRAVHRSTACGTSPTLTSAPLWQTRTVP